MTRVAYFDCPSGASGDMIMAACLDAGLPLELLREALAGLPVTGYRLETERVMKQGLTATRFHVRIEPQHHHRHWSDIRDMIAGSTLSPAVQDLSQAVFRRLALAEGRIHGRDPETVHFHEVGAVDSIIDVVGAAVAWEHFGLPGVIVSPLPLGSGFIDSAHGRLPLPAPATLALLEGAPTYGSGIEAELVTPTGAALLTELAGEFGPRPAMTAEVTGLGAGARDLPDRPNILRLTLGRSDAASDRERLTVAETNIDDLNPEILPYVMDRLLSAGALDVWCTPILMKKGRPAHTLSLLCRPAELQTLTDIVLAETTTLGVRAYTVERACLPRESQSVSTPLGPALVKTVIRNGRPEYVPEFESCRALAAQSGRPLRDVYDMVRRSAEENLENAG